MVNVVSNKAPEQYFGPRFNDNMRPDVNGKVDFGFALFGVISGHLRTFRDRALIISGIHLQSDLSHATWRDGPVVADHRTASPGFDAEDSEYFTTTVFYLECVGYDLSFPVGASIMAGRLNNQGRLGCGRISLGNGRIYRCYQTRN
jgi:hypothetical protein